MNKAARNDGLVTGSASTQLALALRPSRSVSERHFVAAASNAQARRWLNQTGWPDRRLLLCGADSCGKTHLLHIWAHRRATQVLDASRLEAENVAPFVDQMPAALAIDNIDCVTSERALLHLLNQAREHRSSVLMASRLSPIHLPIILPDLASRLRAVTIVPVGVPEDSLRFTLLMRLIAERQLVVSKPLLDWLLCHLPRTGDAIVSAVDRLDAASLARGRPLTLTLARDVLSGLIGDESETVTVGLP